MLCVRHSGLVGEVVWPDIYPMLSLEPCSHIPSKVPSEWLYGHVSTKVDDRTPRRLHTKNVIFQTVDGNYFASKNGQTAKSFCSPDYRSGDQHRCPPHPPISMLGELWICTCEIISTETPKTWFLENTHPTLKLGGEGGMPHYTKVSS